ncbi:MAG: ABC transporter ATP-binding protein [Defluviitaleaceae bacterium]|nr:ABC transporter ATP-binding protein [Defluviitaleaceae bacterium]
MLTIKDLSKSYAGKQALDGLSMRLPQGKIIGLLGPNGSGKTTLMKTIAGLLTPDKGEIEYFGGAKRGIASKKVIAFLPDRMSFPSWMKVSDAFGYFEAMYPDYDSGKAANMQQILELSPQTAISKLSKGMQERLGLALTFSRKAPLYLLDEPLGGIDPVGRAKVLQSIISAYTEDSSIMLSTHLIKDVETVFDSVFFIKDGQIVFESDCEDLRRQAGKKVEDVYLEVFGGV